MRPVPLTAMLVGRGAGAASRERRPAPAAELKPKLAPLAQVARRGARRRRAPAGRWCGAARRPGACRSRRSRCPRARRCRRPRAAARFRRPERRCRERALPPRRGSRWRGRSHRTLPMRPSTNSAPSGDEAIETGVDRDLAGLDACQRADVDHRRAPVLAQLSHRRDARAAQAVAADVADRDVAQEARQRVAEPRRQARQQQRRLLCRPAEHVAMDDVDRRAHRQRGAAPCSTRSSAISAPVLPMPTTSTRWPAKRAPLRYSRLWRSAPVNAARPSIAGTNGTLLAPVVTTTSPRAEASRRRGWTCASGHRRRARSRSPRHRRPARGRRAPRNRRGSRRPPGAARSAADRRRTARPATPTGA